MFIYIYILLLYTYIYNTSSPIQHIWAHFWGVEYRKMGLFVDLCELTLVCLMLTALMLYTDCFHWNDLSWYERAWAMSWGMSDPMNMWQTFERPSLASLRQHSTAKVWFLKMRRGIKWLVTSLLCNSAFSASQLCWCLFREGHVGVLFCSILEFGSGLFVSHNVSEKGHKLIKWLNRKVDTHADTNDTRAPRD